MTQFYTTAQRTELAALAEAATPGPWTSDDDDPEWQQFVLGGGDAICQFFDKRENWFDNRSANIAFIAAARTAIPALLAEVTALRAELQGIEDMMGGDIVLRGTPTSVTTYTARRNDEEAAHD